MTEEIKLLGIDLSYASEAVLAILIDDAADESVYREILTANAHRPEILRLLVESPNAPEDVRAQAAQALQIPVLSTGGNVPAIAGEVSEEEAAVLQEQKKESLLLRMQSLTVGEKISLALKGGRDIRNILAKDSNKEVVLSVVKNPKVTSTEAELLAHSRNIPDEALRAISKNREWMKSYGVMLALVNNPKTPPGISMTLVPNLKAKDLAGLEKNKNVPEGVRTMAKKLTQLKKTR